MGGRSSRIRRALGWTAFSLAIVAVLVLGAAYFWAGTGSDLPMLRGLRPIPGGTSFGAGGRPVSEMRDYVIRMDYHAALKRLTREMRTRGTLHMSPFNEDGKMGGGPFCDLSAGSLQIRLIRGDRTLPPDARKAIPEAERSQWVVVSITEPARPAWQVWLEGLGRRLRGGL